jgi:hypothetical protein
MIAASRCSGHDRPRPPRQFDHEGDAVQLVRHQRDARGVRGDVRSAQAHRDADVGRRERGSVVDAVADHHRARAGPHQLLDLLVLLLGEALGLDRVRADRHADALGHAQAIAREDEDLAHAQLAQARDHCAHARTHLVLQPDRAHVPAVQHHVHAGHALDPLLDLLNLGLDPGVQLDQPRGAADVDLAHRRAGPRAPSVRLVIISDPSTCDARRPSPSKESTAPAGGWSSAHRSPQP